MGVCYPSKTPISAFFFFLLLHTIYTRDTYQVYVIYLFFFFFFNFILFFWCAMLPTYIERDVLKIFNPSTNRNRHETSI